LPRSHPGSRGVPWSRDEVTLALNVYKKLGKVPEERDPLVLEVARLTGRTPDSVVYKVANLRFLDSGGTKGLKHIGKTDRLVWRAYERKGNALGKEAERIADELSRSDPLSEPKHEQGGGGQGFSGSSEERKKIEGFAMSKAVSYFSGKGYAVFDTHANSPYDLRCVKGMEVHFVEVKGTSGEGRNVLLTAGEVNFARLHGGQMILFIVHTVRADGDGALTGAEKIVWPWEIDSQRLTPYNFVYET
jgi:Protein NO VEIN, C-terminal